MTHYLFKLTCRSSQGRTFTLNIKTPSSHSKSFIKSLIEQRCDIEVKEVADVEIFDVPSIPSDEKLFNLVYSGTIEEYFNGTKILIDISKKILPLYDNTFDSLRSSDWIDLQNYFKVIYGDTFVLTYAQMCQAN